MSLTHREVFERCISAGAISRDPEAVAALFTEDGVLEAPLDPRHRPRPSRRPPGNDVAGSDLPRP